VTLPVGDEKVRAVRAMFDAIAPRYDLVNRVMTFGMDIGWRRSAVRALGLGPSALVLDVGAGTGDLCRELARAGYHPVGVDLSLGMLTHAQCPAAMVQGDAGRLPLASASVDGAVSGFALRNFADLSGVFDELGRVVRPGGRVALLEVSAPARGVLRAGHSVYFGHVVPRIGAVLSDASAYRYLPRSVAYLPPVETMLARLSAAGFGSVRRHELSLGVCQLIVATRRVA
jgi:demethylmenaquinone methyltransferase/2-methoxy-6-polyprenyl-1,4-benzoquinol methylase